MNITPIEATIISILFIATILVIGKYDFEKKNS
jgi:hypothetical protein